MTSQDLRSLLFSYLYAPIRFYDQEEIWYQEAVPEETGYVETRSGWWNNVWVFVTTAIVYTV